MTPQFDFLGVPVSDMARSVAFYRLLGLDFPAGAENEQHAEAPLPAGMRYALDTEDVIRSFDPDWKRPSDGYAGGGAFRCDSPEEVDQVYRDLLAAGGSAHKEPWDAFWGQRYAQVRDPDGTVIDLYAALPER
jgi:catechol 2,3-dioxygenase-like lactoylglutathione lyase family enzyme